MTFLLIFIVSFSISLLSATCGGDYHRKVFVLYATISVVVFGYSRIPQPLTTNWRGLTTQQQVAHLKWKAPVFDTKGSVLPFQAFSKQEIKRLIKAMDKYKWLEGVGNTRHYSWQGTEERLEEVASTFLQVWGNESWQYQLLALAISVEESGIGFTRSWKGDWYESDAGACGLTQVKPVNGWSCADLMDTHTAWTAQHWWMHHKWRKYDGQRKVLKYKDWFGKWEGDWEKDRPWIYRYNGGKEEAWAYGRRVIKYYQQLVKISKGDAK